MGFKKVKGMFIKIIALAAAALYPQPTGTESKKRI
jgi:hypothetical protein